MDKTQRRIDQIDSELHDCFNQRQRFSGASFINSWKQTEARWNQLIDRERQLRIERNRLLKKFRGVKAKSA